MAITHTVQRLTNTSANADLRISKLDTESRHSSGQTFLSHPLGVRPRGNALTSLTNLQTSTGNFSVLSDSLILSLLEHLDQDALVVLGRTCRAFFAFTTFDQLWRDIGTEPRFSDAVWRGSWRSTVKQLASAELPPVNCQDLFSDALHRPFFCSQVDMRQYVTDIPKPNQIPTLDTLSQTDFSDAWSDRPFILTNPVKKWPIYSTWSEANLLERYTNVGFRAESVDWSLKKYFDYMNNQKDESPLYLFDRAFVEKMDLRVAPDGDYDPPDCFKEDLFVVLGKQRPDHRWLIIGPERSGSTFHKDPNATSAWNAVIRGSKYWIMFPNSIIPPGVYMSEDQSEVTSPLSIAEWLLTFHSEARRTPGCVEGICHEGEVLHVPSGWWHLVVNLESAIAITQNFVPRTHVHAAVRFLQHKADQVSGFRDDVQDPYSLFIEKLQHKYPDLVGEIERSKTKKRKWEEVVCDPNQDEQSPHAFTFNFNNDIED